MKSLVFFALIALLLVVTEAFWYRIKGDNSLKALRTKGGNVYNGYVRQQLWMFMGPFASSLCFWVNFMVGLLWLKPVHEYKACMTYWQVNQFGGLEY